MLCWMTILGGALIMMGQHDRSEALFYYFRLEDQVPENHLLRLIEKHISFAFVREKLKESYSDTGRPSIDPELLLRILLIGYLYGITSERKLVEELRMHLAWRWVYPDWGSIRRYRTTPRSRKIGTEDFRNRNCSSKCSRRLWPAAWKPDWCKGTTCRWTAVSWRPMPARRAASRGSSWRKRHRSTIRCASIWWN